MRFLAIGECMAEFSPTVPEGQAAAANADGPVGTGGAYRLDFAGDVYNTAWYLSRLRPDAGVAFLTAVGQDAPSGAMIAAMEGAGIDAGFVQRRATETIGLYMIALDGAERSFTYWRSASAARHLAEDPKLLEAALGASDLLYFSGITLAILPPKGRRALLSALAAAKAEGKTIAFDPNLRPALWEEARVMRETVMQAAGISDIVLPSYEDEARHFCDASPAECLSRYRGAGTRTVVVKDGPRPVVWADGRRSGAVETPKAPRILDTTAAGDGFNAGFLSLHDAGAPIEARIAEGSAVARHVIGHRGALAPLPAPACS